MVCGILVLSALLAAFPVSGTAQENLIENGDFSQGLEHWTVIGGPSNTCEPNNPNEPGGYYSCAMVTDHGTPENPHLELYVGSGGEQGFERFLPGVEQTLSRLPTDAGRVTLSLRVWSLGNTSYVTTLIQSGYRENLTVEEMYDSQSDWYQSDSYPSREPTTITRDITNFHDPTTYLFVGGDQVAVDNIAIVVTPQPVEPLSVQQVDLVKNGGFSQGLDYWRQYPSAIGRGEISEKGSSGNPHLELLTGQPWVFQELHLPEDATRISLSIRAWALTPPGQNPENVMPSVGVRVTSDGSISNETIPQETYTFGKNALRMEPASTITRDLTGFKGKNITLTLMGEEAAVDDVTVLAYELASTPTSIISAPFPFLIFSAIVIAIVVGFFLVAKLRRRRI